MPNFISEDQIEQTLLQKLQHVHGYDVLDCNTEEREDLADRSCRASKREVILLDRLREAAVALNPGIPAAVIDSALEKLTDRRLAMLPVAAIEAARLARVRAHPRRRAGGSSRIERMNHRSTEFPELQAASPAEKIELIDELWASIPRESLPAPKSHLTELDRRVVAVQKDPSRALAPEEARQKIRAKTGL